MELHGKQIIGSGVSAEGGGQKQAINPATGEKLPVIFHQATSSEIERSISLAVGAFEKLRAQEKKKRAEFLERAAAEIENLGEDLVERCHLETGLPIDRVRGETGRTTAQLRLFAQLVAEGSWVDARIDRAMPKRSPLPRPDIRYMLMPLGPVVVFCASNFPLAFSVAGGDTASALAAGNPVIVKAHHAHPGTAALVAMAIRKASRETHMPEGTFSLLHGPGAQVGKVLVQHPEVKAVGFTGSQQGGRTLFDLASARPDPIPVYAEMASINPVFVLPDALEQRGKQIAEGLHQSATLGVGQFCTNPGILVLQDGPHARSFVNAAKGLMANTAPAVMLHHGIYRTYKTGLGALAANNHVQTLVELGSLDGGKGGCTARAALFQTDAKAFLEHVSLREEVFGPCTLAVICSDKEEMLQVGRCFSGELTATLHGTDEELVTYGDLARILEKRVGRLIYNGFPTGVEVCFAMNHGGPYPATTDVHFTSVGAASIFRFARPICYQNCPDECLPDELKKGNPLGIWRMVDGERTRV
jgi:alpha-ketoglutaric semialdehyde dehydrogenase